MLKAMLLINSWLHVKFNVDSCSRQDIRVGELYVGIQ